jgi:hypothetical protein
MHDGSYVTPQGSRHVSHHGPPLLRLLLRRRSPTALPVRDGRGRGARPLLPRCTGATHCGRVWLIQRLVAGALLSSAAIPWDMISIVFLAGAPRHVADPKTCYGVQGLLILIEVGVLDAPDSLLISLITIAGIP